MIQSMQDIMVLLVRYIGIEKILDEIRQCWFNTKFTDQFYRTDSVIPHSYKVTKLLGSMAAHNSTQLPLKSTSTKFNDISSVQEEPINLPTNHYVCLGRRSKIWVSYHHKALCESLV